MGLKPNIKVLRRTLMRKGICALPTLHGWVLCKVSSFDVNGSNHPWTFGPIPSATVRVAHHHKSTTAKRSPGTGKGKRPYPKQSFSVAMLFRSELKALTAYTLLEEEHYTWR